MKENKEKRAAEKAAFDAFHAELTKGIANLTNAVNTLKGSRPASMMSLKFVIKTIRQATFMGDAMGHIPKNQRARAILLQQDPDVIMEHFSIWQDAKKNFYISGALMDQGFGMYNSFTLVSAWH